MESPSAIQGREFDWFARDTAGNIAIFATAGMGPVPQIVLAAIEVHEHTGEAILASGWGTPEVWTSYSLAGLYVYDWSNDNGSYVRVAIPAGPVSSAVAEALRATTLPEFPAHFPDLPSLGLEHL